MAYGQAEEALLGREAGNHPARRAYPAYAAGWTGMVGEHCGCPVQPCRKEG